MVAWPCAMHSSAEGVSNVILLPVMVCAQTTCCDVLANGTLLILAHQ
jgi:hypothetical protein